MALLISSLLRPAVHLRAQLPLNPVFPEQRSIQFRSEQGFPRYQLPFATKPNTVTRKYEDLVPVALTLDEAIRVTLVNATVIRVLAGNTAVASGRTIYDAAVTNTSIDQQNSVFDPTLGIDNNWTQLDNPVAGFDPLNPGRAVIRNLKTEGYAHKTALRQQNAMGGTSALAFTTGPQYRSPGTFPLNPQSNPAVELSYNQPLLQGAGLAQNLAPILVARINTERSFYQMKNAVQDQVRGVAEGYWALVFARVDAWVKRQQVEQTEEALRVAEGRFAAELADIAEVAQARTSLANFRANKVAADANLLQREAALRNLMGLPPSDTGQFVPMTPPRSDEFETDWDALCDLAASNRPDLIDLQLTVEADERLLAQAKNTALPKTDAQLLYRWNGIDGRQPNGETVNRSVGQFNDWTAGINVSLPLGLRQARAAQRQQEINLMRDRMNFQQGLHAASHQLATSVRAIDQVYAQYLAYSEARRASRINLERQLALYSSGRSIYLNVLLAINDWGNTISSEANALSQYNTQLALLELQTGTILESHGVYFYEEQFLSTGTFGRLFSDECYPWALHPERDSIRYPIGEKPADETFDLEKPNRPRDDAPLPDLDYKKLLEGRKNRQPVPLRDVPKELLPDPPGVTPRLPNRSPKGLPPADPPAVGVPPAPQPSASTRRAASENTTVRRKTLDIIPVQFEEAPGRARVE